LIHASGELAVARAAGAAGVGYVVAIFAGYRLDEVKAATSGPAWYQLYLVAGREAAEAAIERARLAGHSALVVIVDTPVAGLRERDVRNGMKELLAGSLLAKLPFLPQLLARAQWLASLLIDGGLSETGERNPAGPRTHAFGGRERWAGFGSRDLAGAQVDS
jgi:L-lactate dehydrogenase (cytochrome)